MLSLLLFITSMSFAAPQAITLTSGEPAPYDGTLLNAEAVAKILSESKANDDTCKVKIELATEIEKAKYQRDVSLLSNRTISCENSLETLDDKYKTLTTKYNRLSTITPVATGVGFVGGIILTLIVANSI